MGQLWLGASIGDSGAIGGILAVSEPVGWSELAQREQEPVLALPFLERVRFEYFDHP